MRSILGLMPVKLGGRRIGQEKPSARRTSGNRTGQRAPRTVIYICQSLSQLIGSCRAECARQMSSTLSGNGQPPVPLLCSDTDRGLPGKSMALDGMLQPIFQHRGQRQLPSCTPRQVFFCRGCPSSTFLWLPNIILPSYRYKYCFTSIRWAAVIESDNAKWLAGHG